MAGSTKRQSARAAWSSNSICGAVSAMTWESAKSPPLKRGTSVSSGGREAAGVHGLPQTVQLLAERLRLGL